MQIYVGTEMDGLSGVGKYLDLDVGSRTVYNTRE